MYRGDPYFQKPPDKHFFELSCARLSELYNAASLFKGWSQIPLNPERIHKWKKHEVFPGLNHCSS